MTGDPVSTIAILGLMGGSAVAQNQGRRAVEKEQKSLVRRDSERQKGYADRSRAALDKALSNMDPASQSQQLSDQGLKLGGEYQVPAPDYVAPVEQVSTTPKEVRQEAARRISDSIEQGKQFARRRGNADAYGALDVDNNIGMGKMYDEMGLMENFGRGSANVLDYELTGAHDKAMPYNNVADALGTAGNLYSMYSFTQPTTKTIPRSRPNFGH